MTGQLEFFNETYALQNFQTGPKNVFKSQKLYFANFHFILLVVSLLVWLYFFFHFFFAFFSRLAF